MSDVAIRVAGLGKQYQIGCDRKPYKTIRESITDIALNPLRRLRAGFSADAPNGEHAFWALKDVGFEVNRGEVVGIIGRNGAGKSTLLKILSRITEPTEGEVEIAGRVGSLLEVGTGFHPELTGRENIYLNGAILGMKRSEIHRRFDEIVAFSEIERFLETPVKHYSSGMYTRLAFAVAAHLEPEILIVDEVLAVGDAAFQKKCLGKMGDVARHGRTVLLVSHNMAAIENLCPTSILLSGGRIANQGCTRNVIRSYLQTLGSFAAETRIASRTDRTGTGEVRLTSFHLEDTDGRPLTAVTSGMDVVFVFGFECRRERKVWKVDPGLSLGTNDGYTLTVFYSSYTGSTLDAVGRGTFRCRIDRFPLSAGRYTVGARLVAGGEEADWLRGPISLIDVESGDFYGTGHKGFEGSTPLLIDGVWEVSQGS
jgi:homopolymeric O-antigen transport system ATP-binding protein